MTIDKNRLKALAEAATIGPWSVEGDDLYWHESGYTKHLMETINGRDACYDPEHPANLAFIAAANPATILALMGEIDLLESYLCECEECGGEGQIFLGTYSSGGHMEPPEPDLEKCRGCDGKGVIGTPQQLHSVIAERDQIKADNEALRKALGDCADGLQAEVICKHGGQKVEKMHLENRRLYHRDMAAVVHARAAMAKEKGRD